MLIKSPIIQQQKEQLKNLEKKYQELVVKRDELLKNIEDFNNEYNLKFAKLLNEILNLKEENVYKKIELYKLKKEKLLKDENVLKKLEEKKYEIQAKIDKIKHILKFEKEDENLLIQQKELEIALSEVNSQIDFIETEKNKFQREDFESLEDELYEAKKDKKEFNEEIKESEKTEKLDKEDKDELRKIYRKIAKLIHPDVVDTSHIQEASMIMAKVNELYRLNKLEELRNIYLEVVNKNFTLMSDSLDENVMLQKQLDNLNNKIIEIQKEINEIEESDILDIIKNKESYFNETQNQLNQRLADLKTEKSYIEINLKKYLEF